MNTRNFQSVVYHSDNEWLNLKLILTNDTIEQMNSWSHPCPAADHLFVHIGELPLYQASIFVAIGKHKLYNVKTLTLLVPHKFHSAKIK